MFTAKDPWLTEMTVEGHLNSRIQGYESCSKGHERSNSYLSKSLNGQNTFEIKVGKVDNQMYFLITRMSGKISL